MWIDLAIKRTFNGPIVRESQRRPTAIVEPGIGGSRGLSLVKPPVIVEWSMPRARDRRAGSTVLIRVRGALWPQRQGLRVGGTGRQRDQEDTAREVSAHSPFRDLVGQEI